MTTHELDSQTLDNIRQARTLAGRPPDDYMVDFDNVGHVLQTHAAAMPDKIWLIHYDAEGQRETITYGDFERRVNQAANLLAGDLGVRRGDRVATIAHNHPATVLIYFACWKIGAAVAPQNIAEDDQRIGYILKNSEAVVALAHANYLERAERIVNGDEPVDNIRQIVQVGGDAQDGYQHFDTLLAAQPDTFAPADPPNLEDESLLVYTSGTTGPPKGVVLTQYNMLVDAQGIANWQSITPEQRMMCVLPIHHVNGTIVTLVTPMFVGASTVLNRAYSSSQFWQRIAAEKVHIVSVVPTLLQFSLDYAAQQQAASQSIWGDGLSAEDVAQLRHIICGAGTLAISLARNFEETFDKPILHGYGLSETTCYSCSLPIDLDKEAHRRWMQDYGFPSIGIGFSPNEMDIFDPSGNGQKLGPGERGEICIRGHNIMKYYFQRPDANASTFPFGWFRSGDEGFYELDEQGRKFFFITGRIKELINRGGVKFSPFDIEETLLEIPGVKVGLAIAFENDYYGEEVGAYVVLEEGANVTDDEILAYCRAHMTFEKSPKIVIFGDDIPVTSTGKYQRLMLRDRFVEWKGTQFRG